MLPRVHLEEGKNTGRNSTSSETDVKNIMGGAELGRAGASGWPQEPERKEGFPRHESGGHGAKPAWLGAAGLQTQEDGRLGGQQQALGLQLRVRMRCEVACRWWRGQEEVVIGVQAHGGNRGPSAGKQQCWW